MVLKKPIRTYDTAKSRFFSEYGFQSFPAFESVKKFASKEVDWNIYSEVMMAHQRDGNHANALIEQYLTDEFRKPKDFSSFLYTSQVLQGDAIKIAIEAHRRSMPYTMGSLFWQMNDSWPVVSWASIDYYGKWKAVQHYAKEAYKDILISPVAENDSLKVYGVSDRWKNTAGNLKITVMKFNGDIVAETGHKVSLTANASKLLFAGKIEHLLKGVDRKEVLVKAVFEEHKEKRYSNVYFLAKQKELNYPKPLFTKTIKPAPGGYTVSITAGNFARAVYLSIPGAEASFDNNYFDIIPGETISTVVKTNISLNEMERGLQVMCVADTY